MSTALNVIALVSVATLFGSMAFFSCVVAPQIFIQLDASTAGRFVRSIFPWYYLVIAGLALIATASLAALRPVEAMIMGLIAVGAFVSRQILMPRINHHRDRMGLDDRMAENRFAQLHRLSVWINGAQLVGAFSILVHLGMA